MGNIIDYVNSSSASFADEPFNELDALVFSEISYCHFDCAKNQSVSIGEAVKAAAENASGNNKSLLEAIANSKRYADLKVSNYVEKTVEVSDTQFAAVTIELDSETSFVSFRGTDGTINGWEDDFNLAYMQPTSTQSMAVEYLENAAVGTEKLIVGGHSKGGNSAVFSSLNCSEAARDKIAAVFNFDGPGTTKDLTDTVAYRELEDRIYKYVPENSVIGMLLNEKAPNAVIKSTNSGIESHDGFSWEIDENGFRKTELSPLSEYIDDVLDDWMLVMSNSQKATLVTFIKTAMACSGEKDFDGVMRVFTKLEAGNIIKTLVPAFVLASPLQKQSMAQSLGLLVMTAMLEGIKRGAATAVQYGAKLLEDACKKTEDFFAYCSKRAKELVENYVTGGGIFAIATGYCRSLVDRIKKSLNKSTSSSKSSSPARFYADTAVMHRQAQQCAVLKRRMERLEERILGLYSAGGIEAVDMISVLREVNNGTWVLTRCANYLDGTADDLERAERRVINEIR